MKRFTSVVFMILFFTNSAYASFLDKIASEAKKVVQDKVEEVSGSQTQKTEEKSDGVRDIQQVQSVNKPESLGLSVEQVGGQSQEEVLNISESTKNREYIELAKGMYGVSFNVSMQEVLSWCEQKKLKLFNSTDSDIDERIKKIAERIKSLSKEVKNNVSAIEQEIFKMETGGADIQDVFEKITASQIKELLKIKKYPAVVYGGLKYYLDPLFVNSETQYGIPFVVEQGSYDSKKVYCDDEEVMNSYILTVTPDEEMQKDGVERINIFLLKDNAQIFKSYASSIIIKDKASFERISNILDEKYGKSDSVSVTSGVVTEFGIVGSESAPVEPLYWNIFYLTRISMEPLMVWKNNVVGNDFQLSIIYYEPNLAKIVIAGRLKAMESCKAKALQAEQDRKENLKDKF